MPHIVHTTPEYRVQTRRDYIANSTRSGGILHLEHMERMAQIAFSPQHGIVDAPGVNFQQPDTMSEIHRKMRGMTPQERFAHEVRQKEKVIVAENAFHLAHLKANEDEAFRRGRHMALFPTEEELEQFDKRDDQLLFKAKARQRTYEEMTLENRRLLTHLHRAVPHVQRTKALGDWYQNVHLKRLKQLRRFKKAEPFAGAEALKECLHHARRRLCPPPHPSTHPSRSRHARGREVPPLLHSHSHRARPRVGELEGKEGGESTSFPKPIPGSSRTCSSHSLFPQEEDRGEGLLDANGELRRGWDGGPSRLRLPPRRWKHPYPTPSYAAFARAAAMRGKPSYPTAEDEAAAAKEVLERDLGLRRGRRPSWKGSTVRDIPLLHYISDTALLHPRGIVSRANEAPVSQLWREEVERLHPSPAREVRKGNAKDGGEALQGGGEVEKYLLRTPRSHRNTGARRGGAGRGTPKERGKEEAPVGSSPVPLPLLTPPPPPRGQGGGGV